MNNRRINRIRAIARAAKTTMPDTFLDHSDPLSLTAFLASQSPVRATVEVYDPVKCWIVETVDGQKYGFTLAQVLGRFDTLAAFQTALDVRKEEVAAAGIRNIVA